jgi:hypothetical protein
MEAKTKKIKRQQYIEKHRMVGSSTILQTAIEKALLCSKLPVEFQGCYDTHVTTPGQCQASHSIVFLVATDLPITNIRRAKTIR